MTIAVLIFFAGILYAASFGSAGMGTSEGRRVGLSPILAILGFALHTAALALRIAKTGELPVGTSYDLVEFITWAFVLIQLWGAGFFKIKLVGLFSMLPAALLTLLPLGCPMFAEAMDGGVKPAITLVSAHAATAVISYAFMVAGATSGAMYLAQNRFLREKSDSRMARVLPPLKTSERATAACLETAFASMLVSFVLGWIALSGERIDALMSLKLATAFFIFVLQFLLCMLAASRRIAGVRLAKAVIILAIISFILLIPIELRTVF